MNEDLYKDLYETLKNEYQLVWDEWDDNDSEEKLQLADMLLHTVRDECYWLEGGYSNFQTPDEILEAARGKMDAIKDMTDEEAGVDLRYYQRNGMDIPLNMPLH